MMAYTPFIVIDPNIRFGKPCIKGTRISVYEVLNWLAEGMSIDNILSDYPEFSNEAVRVCLAYAADREHRFKIAS